MDFSPINPKCCFCGKFYLGEPSATTQVATEAEKIEFLQFEQYCKSCNENLANQNYDNKCFKCFSSNHCTKNCKEEEIKFFCPKIDTVLFTRFNSMLDEYEKYFFAFSSREVLKTIKLKHLIVVKKMELSEQKFYIPTFNYSNILVTEDFECFGLNYDSNVTSILYDNVFTSILTTTLFINTKDILLHNLQISTDNFFLLLSSKTAMLKLCEVKFEPGIQFSSILKAMPNVERFILRFTNIEYDQSWIKNLSLCKKLNSFFIPYSSLGIPWDSMRGVIKAWSKNQTRIVLDIKKIDKILYQNLSKFKIETCAGSIYASKIM